MLRNTRDHLRRFVGAMSLIASLCATSAALAADTLVAGQSMAPGQSLESGDANYRFNFQRDGNLVIRRSSDDAALWSSKTSGSGAARLVLQNGGNLALVTSGGSTIWSAGTSNATVSRMTIQNDGNLVLYSTSATPFWSTETVDVAPAATSIASYIGFASAKTTASTLNITRPSAVQAGDVMVLITQGGDGQLPDAQSGWTRFARCFERGNADTVCSTSGEDMGLVAYYRVATTTGQATYTLQRGAAGHITAAIFVVRNANSASPIFSYKYLPNDGKSSESHCPSTAGITGGQHLCIYSHDDPQPLANFGGLTLRGGIIISGEDSVHITSAQLSNNNNTPYIVATNVGSTDGGNNDLQLAIVVRPK